MYHRNEYNSSYFIPPTNSAKQMIKIWLCFAFLVLPLVFADDLLNECNPVLTIKWGSLCGKWTTTVHGRRIANYLRIPYALPLIEYLRFKNPEPWIWPWEGLRNATYLAPNCLGIYPVKGASEDCLYLNIYVPEISKTGNQSLNLTVLVLLQTGSYVEGNGNSKLYKPEYLLDKDMILVTVNYRMTIFGFFSTMNQASPGNYGLKDIVLALKWIQENIIDFNGDANSVTLMGNSISSEMVHLLALSNKTEGLFHKYILISGSALSSWNMQLYDWKEYRKTCLEVANFVGCLAVGNPLHNILQESDIIFSKVNKTDHLYDSSVDTCEDPQMTLYYNMINCLRLAPTERLIAAVKQTNSPLLRAKFTFGPTLEAESEDAILTMHPVKILKEGLFRDIPVLMLVMEDEGLSLTRDFIITVKYFNKDIKTKLIEEYKLYFSDYLHYYEIINDTNKFANAIDNFYFNGNLTANLMRNFTEVVGDGAIRWPMFKAMQYHAKFGNSSIYLFNLAYEGTFSFTIGCSYSDLDHCRYKEMKRIFGERKYPIGTLYLYDTQNERIIMNVMTKMLENFIRKRQPKADQILPIIDYRNSSEFVKIGNGDSTDITVETDFFTERMNFWDNLMSNVLNERNVDLYNMLISSREK